VEIDMLRSVLLLVLFLLGLAACGECATPPVGGPSVPGETAADEAPWGDAVGGLALGLDVPQEVYGPSDEMVFGVRARNVAEDPLKLHFFDDNMWHYRITFEDAGDGSDFWGGSGLFLDFSEPPDVTLKPGASWTRSADLTAERRRYLRIIEDRKPGDDWDYRDVLPAGRYRAYLEYAPKVGNRAGYWKGTARTNTVEITVTE